MIVDARHHLSSRWTEDVWSSLKLFAESELHEFDILRLPMRTLPAEEVDAWDALITEAQREIERLDEPAYAMDARFCHLLRILNREWFLPRSLILMRGKRRPGSTVMDLWDQSGVGIGVVVDASTFLLEGEAGWGISCHRPAVTFYHARWIFPNPIGFGTGMRDPAVPGVVINLDQVDEGVRQASVIIPEPAHLASKIVLPHTRSANLAACREHGEFLRRRYKNTRTLATVLFHQVGLAELRQAINELRASLTGNEMPDTIAEQTQVHDRLVNRLLSDSGSVRRLLWIAESWEALRQDVPQTPKLPQWRTKMARARALSLASAEMTAAAVGPDPVFAVLSWNKDLRIAAAETQAGGYSPDTEVDADFCVSCGHPSVVILSAITWTVTLLAGQLGWGPLPPLRSPTHADMCQAYALAQRLRNETPDALRLALKAAYSREFRDPIDECPPFMRINAAGMLQGRP